MYAKAAGTDYLNYRIQPVLPGIIEFEGGARNKAAIVYGKDDGEEDFPILQIERAVYKYALIETRRQRLAAAACNHGCHSALDAFARYRGSDGAFNDGSVPGAGGGTARLAGAASCYRSTA